MKLKILILVFTANLYTNQLKSEFHFNNKSSSKQDTTSLDSIPASEQQESDFQANIDTLFQGVDTFAWDNKMINSGHFDSKDMKDTINIVIQDTSKHLYFTFPFKNYVTSGFGKRRWLWHYGMDIKLQKGDSVYAAMDGIVRVTKYDRHGFGYVVVIRHPSGLETIYGHLSKIKVNIDQKVKSGELIGLGGSTGHSTGTHLHFETRFLGEPFDPNCFIDFENYKLKTDTLALSRQNFEYLIDLRKAKYCTIRRGDTLGRIAIRYGTSINALCRLNGMSRKSLLRIGRPLRYQ